METSPDDLNPKYLFTGIATVLLAQIAKKEIDPLKLACKELSERGLDLNGNWIGFANSKELFKNYL